MTFRLFIVAVIALAALGVADRASAAFSVYYYQDGRDLRNLPAAQGLVASTAPVAFESLDYLNLGTSNTTDGNFYSLQTAVPLTVEDNFAVFATGLFYVGTAGTYTFNTFSDDGFSLDIDGSRVAFQNNPRAPANTTTSVFLTQGYHALDMLYYERTGRAVLELSYAQGSFASFNPGNFSLLVSSAPEPDQWALMLLGFAVTAFRLKQMRRNGMHYAAAHA